MRRLIFVITIHLSVKEKALQSLCCKDLYPKLNKWSTGKTKMFLNAKKYKKVKSFYFNGAYGKITEP